MNRISVRDTMWLPRAGLALTIPTESKAHDVRLSSAFYSRHYYQQKTQSFAHKNRDTRGCIDDDCGALKIIIIDSRCRVHASIKDVSADLLWVGCKKIFHFVRQA